MNSPAPLFSCGSSNRWTCGYSDAQALHGAAAFLPVASLDESPTTSLAEGNVGLAAIIIQSTGVYGSEAAQCEIRSIDRRIHHRFYADLLCFIIEDQFHRQFR